MKWILKKKRAPEVTVEALKAVNTAENLLSSAQTTATEINRTTKELNRILQQNHFAEKYRASIIKGIKQ